MKRALAVLNIGGKSLHPKSRASFMAACARWGCDFKEFTEQIAPRVHHYWQKAFVIERLQEYDQVLQLDADMLIRSDCPSPFDLVPHDAIGVVSARQCLTHAWIRGREVSMAAWAKRLKMKKPNDFRHLNGGFILYSPETHAPLFSEWRKIGRRYKFTPKELPEQATLSILVGNTPGLRVVWLPHTFDCVGVNQLSRQDRIGSRMKGYIYHFNHGDKQRRIDGTMWDHPGWSPVIRDRSAEIISRIPQDREVVGAEVGVRIGENAAAIMFGRERCRLLLVDMWAEHPDGGTYKESRDANSRYTNDDWRVMLGEVLQRLDLYHGRFRLLQGDSRKMARCVDDRSLDFVFVDADHSKEGCLADIDAWLPKVKPGGWIGGHDYRNKWGGKWGVRDAVLTRFDESRVETGKGDTWFVYV